MTKELQHVSACGIHFPVTSRGKFLWKKFNWKMNHTCWQVLAHKVILSGHQNRASLCTIKTSGEVEVFAGCERKEGTVDGKVQDCHFRQSMGICTESESVIYTCDAQTNSIKTCSKMVVCAKFLNSVGQLFDAFSIRCKGTGYSVKPANEALSLVCQCKQLLERNTNEIRMSTGITSAINGPHGRVAARTMASVALLEWGLRRLYSNLQPFN